MKIKFTAKINKPIHKRVAENLKTISMLHAAAYIESFNGKAIPEHAPARDVVHNWRHQSRQNKDTLINKRDGEVTRLLNSLFDAGANHAPPSNQGLGDWIGVEIECMIPIETAIEAFRPLNIHLNQNTSEHSWCDDHEETADSCGCGCSCAQCEGSLFENYREQDLQFALIKYIKASKIKRISVKSDGSIDADDGCFPVELTCVFHKDDRSSLNKLCDTLNSLGARVNKSCGMHVHLDQRDLMVASTFKATQFWRRANNLTRALPLLAGIVPKTRRENTYCRLKCSELTGDRYTAINCTAFKKYKTIEVRLHSATTDAAKINNWIDLLLLISRAKALPAIKNIDDLCAVLDVPERLITHIEKRTEKFSFSEAVEENYIKHEYLTLESAVA